MIVNVPCLGGPAGIAHQHTQLRLQILRQHLGVCAELEPVLLERESTNRKDASPNCEVVVLEL